MKWYVLYTAAKAEKQVEQRLKADGVEVFLPLHRTPRKWSDRVKMVEVPLFSSYIFVRCTDEVLRTLTRKSGVSRIIFHNSTPATVRPKEIQAIKDFLSKADGKECEFHIDETVQVVAGPLKNVKGIVVKVTKDYLILVIHPLHIRVKIKADQVLK